MEAPPRGSRFARYAGGWILVAAIVGGLLWWGIRSGTCEPTLKGWTFLFVYGLTLGFIYALIALGYTMVYGVLQLINFAHSEVFMIGSFAGLYAISKLFSIGTTDAEPGSSGVALYLILAVGLLLAGLASAATAVGIERVAYRPLRKRGVPRLNYLITAIGVSLFLSNLFQLLDGQKHLGLPFNWPAIAGKEALNYAQLMPQKTAFSIFGVHVLNQQLLIIAVAIIMLVALDRFVNRTRTGQGIRAVAEDPQTASILGVNINRIIVITFAIGGFLAGVAGVLYGMYFNQAVYNMGFTPGIKAFTAAVLGGIGNIRGAMLGGVVLGLIENLGTACTGVEWQSVIAFSVLVLVLMFKPTGLLGERVAR
jgi:branched-chain amino acid transport system permease protein